MKNILRYICELKEYQFTLKIVKPIFGQSYTSTKPKSILFKPHDPTGDSMQVLINADGRICHFM
jgi:hypothetical protein